MKRFEVYCPAGWIRIDLDGDLAAQARVVTDSLVPAGGGDLRRAHLHATSARLTASLEALAEGGAWSMLLPVAGPTAIRLRPTIVFAPWLPPAGVEPMDALVAIASADPTASVIDIDPLLALRTCTNNDVTDEFVEQASAVTSIAPSDSAEAPRPDAMDGDSRAVARRVRYVLGDPVDKNRWTDVKFSLTHLDSPEQAELAESAIASFDAIVKTFRWMP